MELAIFDEVADAIRGLVPSDLGELRPHVRRYGIKVWFDSERAPAEHYEAQLISAKGVVAAKHLALEVGFHAEHRGATENDAVVAHLLSCEKVWRPAVGREAVVGPFLGHDVWRRLSETWPDPDLDSAGLAVEIAVRLTDYIVALEPVRRREVTGPPRRRASRRELS